MVQRMPSVIVLLGPPGSGKSSIGAELADRGFRWRDWEVYLLSVWGSGEAFVANKAEALPALHEEIVRWIDADGPVAVIESTGLSDAPLIASLDARGSALVARLQVSESTALERCTTRPQGQHLSDGVEANRRVLRAFEERIVPAQRVDLVIDTEEHSVRSAASIIVDVLGP